MLELSPFESTVDLCESLQAAGPQPDTSAATEPRKQLKAMEPSYLMLISPQDIAQPLPLEMSEVGVTLTRISPTCTSVSVAVVQGKGWQLSVVTLNTPFWQMPIALPE